MKLNGPSLRSSMMSHLYLMSSKKQCVNTKNAQRRRRHSSRSSLSYSGTTHHTCLPPAVRTPPQLDPDDLAASLFSPAQRVTSARPARGHGGRTALCTEVTAAGKPYTFEKTLHVPFSSPITAAAPQHSDLEATRF